MDGVESIVLTTSDDYTLSTSNYTTTDESLNRVLKFTGTLSAAVNVVAPSVEHNYLVSNECGQTLTIKTAAGTGVSIPTGRMALVYCDASNVDSDGLFVNGPLTISGVLSGVSTAVAGTDAVNKTQMDAAIAAAALPAVAGTVKVDAAATAGYLGVVLTYTGTRVVWVDDGDTLDLDSSQLDTDIAAIETDIAEIVAQDDARAGVITSTLSSGTTALAANRRHKFTGTATGTMPTFAVGDFLIIEYAQALDVVATVGLGANTSIDGTAANQTMTGLSTGTGPVVLYSCNAAGVVTSSIIGSVQQ